MKTASSGQGTPPGVFHDPNVMRWLIAYTASILGDGVYFIALGWTANQIAGPSRVGLVLAVGAIPRAALMLIGGVIADRWGPRRIIILSDGARCIIILTTAAALALLRPGIWVLVAIALIFGVVDALFMPAVGALPPHITTHDQLARVQGLRALAIRTGGTVGAPIAGAAMALHGTPIAFATAGAMFALSFFLLLSVRVRAPDHPNVRSDTAPPNDLAWVELTAGLRYAATHPTVRPLILSGSLGQLGAVAPLNVGLILLASTHHWGATGVGWTIASFSLGAAVSAIFLSARGWIPHAGAIQLATLALGSIGIGLLGLSSQLPEAIALAAAVGLVAGIFNGLNNALLQTSTDPAFLGRITAVTTLVGLGLAPLTYPLFSTAAVTIGLGPTFLTFAALGLIGALIGATSRPGRHAQLPSTTSLHDPATPQPATQ